MTHSKDWSLSETIQTTLDFPEMDSTWQMTNGYGSDTTTPGLLGDAKDLPTSWRHTT